jgi:hypothetical protein
MLPYKNVYSLENGKLVKNKENKIEYAGEDGKKRIKTNPTYKDFAKVGKYPLKEMPHPEYDRGTEELVPEYEIKDETIVIKYAVKEADRNEK